MQCNELRINRHRLLRSNELRRRITLTDAKIIAQSRMSAIGRGHHLTRSIAFNLAGRIARRALHFIVLMSDIEAFQLYRRWLRNYRSVRGGLVAVEYQVTLHGLLC
jgi:hypothetical protein